MPPRPPAGTHHHDSQSKDVDASHNHHKINRFGHFNRRLHPRKPHLVRPQPPPLVAVLRPGRDNHTLPAAPPPPALRAPAPPTPAAEEAMITTLQNQLQFVRAVQRVDARDVEPLRAIRDETIAAREELALGVEDLSEVLGREMRVGKLQRVRRIREKVEPDAEKWDALSTARRTAGRYFVVESGKKDVEGAE